MNKPKLQLENREKLYTYKNKFTQEIFYSTSKYEKKHIDGTEFVTVFPFPTDNVRKPRLMRADALERIINI